MTIDTKRIKEILKLLDEGLTRDEFVKSFKDVIDYTKSLEKRIKKLEDK